MFQRDEVLGERLKLRHELTTMADRCNAKNTSQIIDEDQSYAARSHLTKNLLKIGQIIQPSDTTRIITDDPAIFARIFLKQTFASNHLRLVLRVLRERAVVIRPIGDQDVKEDHLDDSNLSQLRIPTPQ
ncbi:hypothetical protein DD563_13125 [Pelagicola sp. LXJ1103]|nr:hypothetical protein DD563_13125 [Pelagicola sp. LXJ1103]